jgi:hypothetical protein
VTVQLDLPHAVRGSDLGEMTMPTNIKEQRQVKA